MNELPFTLTSYPRLGVPQVFTEPHFDPTDAVSSQKKVYQYSMLSARIS